MLIVGDPPKVERPTLEDREIYLKQCRDAVAVCYGI